MSYKQKTIEALEAYHGKCKGVMASTVADCIRIIREIPEGDGWKSVKNELPAEFVSVFVHIPKLSHIPTVKKAYRVWNRWYTMRGSYSQDEVTHWMPLPEPPKEEK